MTCPTCSGMGKVRAQQGFFTIERTCPTCGGRGVIVKNPCQVCDGAGVIQTERSLSVQIPEGVEDGQRIRLAGEGEPGLRGGSAGDLYIFISIRPHDIFKREGADLLCEVTVPFAAAAIGGSVETPTPDGGRTTVAIPEGTQNGKQLRLRGKGMPVLKGGRYGDLYLHVNVETPQNLTARQKDLLQQFAKESSESQHPATEAYNKKAQAYASKG